MLPNHHNRVRLELVLAAIERNRPQVWALCYRLTGDRANADDLSQEAVARALERHGQFAGEDATAWLLRLTGRICLDFLRRRTTALRVNELADPVVVAAMDPEVREPEDTLILREDFRYAVVVALTRLPPRQRVALVLREVCELSLAEIADVLDVERNAAKAVLYRARSALATARVQTNVDTPVDALVVEQFAHAVGAGDVNAITELLGEDVWGLVDGGAHVRTASKPTFGPRAVARQWANAKRRVAAEVTTQLVIVNAEPAVLIRLIGHDAVLAIVHLETRAGRIRALRINRDPVRIARLGPASTVPYDPANTSI